MELNEKISRLIKKIINEELGINNDVVRATNDIMNMVNTMSDDEFRDIPIGKNRHHPCKAANIDYTFANDKVIRLNICVYDFENVEEIRGFCKTYPMEGRKMVNAKTHQADELSKITITLSIITINGRVTPPCYNALQHELEHAFQRIMSGKTSLVKNQDKYNKNIDLMGKGSDIFVKNAARINYYSYPHEQNAFMNGLYGELKYRIEGGEDFNVALNDTKYMGVLNRLKKVVEEFKGLDGNEKAKIDLILKKEFNYGVDTVIKKGMTVIDKFIYNLGRVKSKIVNEIQN